MADKYSDRLMSMNGKYRLGQSTFSYTVVRINIDAPNIFVFLNKYTIRLKYDTTDSKIKGKSFFTEDDALKETGSRGLSFQYRKFL